MSDIDRKVWQAYHLDTVQPDHPLRLLCEELRATRVSCERMLDLARENGAARDEARRALLRARPAPVPRYPTFEAYFEEIEMTGTRGERFFDELEGASNTRMVEWLRAAFDAARAAKGEDA